MKLFNIFFPCYHKNEYNSDDEIDSDIDSMSVNSSKSFHTLEEYPMCLYFFSFLK